LSPPQGEQAWELFVREQIAGSGRKDWRVLIAEDHGQAIGHIVGYLRNAYPVFEPERYGYVTDIVVAPEARRQGVAQALFQTLRAWFREQGVRHIELQAARNNRAAQAFWHAMGFTGYIDTLWLDLEEV
jgi:ribosomal protein S18 acetylase RimI-like enzyme